VANTTATTQDSDACARCAQRFGSCCRLEPGQEEYCFPLSAAEHAGMTAAGAKPEHFAAQENTAAFVENLCRLFPGEEAALRALFPLGDAHERLAITPAGTCGLLGESGCGLPRAARPLYCLLYPFWIRGGLLMYFEFERCLALLEGCGAGSLMRRLGMVEAGIRTLHNDLRMAWGLQKKG
jgi:hypothetical protein